MERDLLLFGVRYHARALFKSAKSFDWHTVGSCRDNAADILRGTRALGNLDLPEGTGGWTEAMA